MNAKKTMWMLVAALGVTLSAKAASASQCFDQPFEGKWVAANGNGPAYTGSQMSYSLGALNLGANCYDDSQTTCSDEGGERTCSTSFGVRQVITVSIGSVTGSFTGPPQTLYSSPVETTFDNPWYTASTTVEGNPTVVWFFPNGSGLRVVFDVTVNGKMRRDYVDFVRPLPHVKLPVHIPGLGN